MVFRDWFWKQIERNDIVGVLAEWFFKKGRGRLPDKESDQFQDWDEKIYRKSAKVYNRWAHAALLTTWAEWEGVVNEKVYPPVTKLGAGGSDDHGVNSGEMVKVRSTVARVAFAVKGPRETGGWDHEEIISVAKFQGPVVYIGLKAKLTANLGNYDSASIEGTCLAPCYPEELGEMSKLVDEIAIGKLNEQMDQLAGVRVDGRHFGDILAGEREPFEPVKKEFKGDNVQAKSFLVKEGENMETGDIDDIVSNEEAGDELVYEPIKVTDDDTLF